MESHSAHRPHGYEYTVSCRHCAWVITFLFAVGSIVGWSRCSNSCGFRRMMASSLEMRPGNSEAGCTLKVLQKMRYGSYGMLVSTRYPRAFIGHVDGDPDCCGCGPLARAGLQHEQLALLNCELDLVHVPVVLLQLLSYSHELPEHVGHEFFQRGKLTTMGQSSLQGELAWRTDTGHHILTLSIDKELPIEVGPQWQDF